MKPKINNAEDKAYILKLENEINKLKSTLEMQSNIRQQNEQTEAASCNINSSQQSTTSNHLNYNHHSNDTVEQRFRMLEMQMMQSLSMNNMLANQHMQLMMQQQQMMQQKQYVHHPSFQHSSFQPNPNLGFSMYPHMSIQRHIPPLPGYLQNITTNVPVGTNQHPLHYQQPIVRQNAYQQHMHHSANYQPIQRENRNNMPPQPRPAVFNRSSDRQPDNRNKHHNRMNIKKQQDDNCPQETKPCSTIPNPKAIKFNEAQVKTNYINRPSDIPLFASPRDIPCNKTSANITQQEILQQTLPTSNCSPQDDTSAIETKQNCPTTLESTTSHQAKPEKSFLEFDQINPPPGPNMIRIAQS
ncbi:unnamed protein product [Mytilus coruscus]|uniref:Uncharacterized protein n=1 Tax=Mytilus coruscus TaxID=42192 RepID=A0A6J7ZYW6_MYTCO|nr:unnamed protein product [Mytilus coruscus]